MMSENFDFSTLDVDLSGLDNFSSDLSNLPSFVQDTTSDPSPLDIRKAQIAAEVAAKAGQQAPQAVRQTADLTNYYNALREGTTVTDIDTVGQSYDQVLNETLANQGIVDTDYAEGGSAGVSKPTVDAFTTPDYAPRELGEFQGNLSAHTSSSLDEIKEFQARLEPLMAPELARLQTQEKLDYKDAVEQAYLQNPEIRALYNEYDVKPFRATEDGSIYLYDPFTFGEIRTLEVKDNDLKKAIKAVTQIGVSILTGGALSTVQTAASVGLAGQAASQAALAGFTTAAQGGDKDAILNSMLMAGGTTLLKGAVDKVKEGVENVAEETLQTVSPELSVEIPEIVSVEAAEAAVAEGAANYVPTAADFARDYVLDKGQDAYNELIKSNTAFKKAMLEYSKPLHDQFFSSLADDSGFLFSGPSVAESEFSKLLPSGMRPPLNIDPGEFRTGTVTEAYDAAGNLIVDPTPSTVDPGVARANTLPSQPTPAFEYERNVFGFGDPTQTYTANIENVSAPRPVVNQSYLQVASPPSGGGGGALGGTGLAGGATTTTSGSVSVTPNIEYTAPGAVTSSLFSDFITPSAAFYSGYTTASPITPVATTAPTTEPTQPTTTEPTSIFDDTTDDTTTAPVTTGGGSTGGVEDPISTGGAEGAGAEGGASGGADDGSGTEGDGVSGQEGGDDTAGDGTTAGGGAGDAGDAEGAGEGTGEGEGTGDGTGTGDGSGRGSGRGSGLGGMGGAGAGDGLFSDYEDPYNAPALLERVLPLEGYTPIDVANQIENLRSFSFLEPQQVRESLSLFGNPLLEESVMQKLYKTGN